MLTRWCTWLKAAIYYCDNFTEVESVIDSFDSNDSEAIRAAKELFADSRIKRELAYNKTHFAHLVPATIKLETQGLKLSESIHIITSTRDSLNAMNEKEFGQKMEAVLDRNPGFKTILNINNVLNERKQPKEQFVKDLLPHELALYKHCPTAPADVERSFSMYANALTDKRRNFLFENLKQHCIVLCNRQNK